MLSDLESDLEATLPPSPEAKPSAPATRPPRKLRRVAFVPEPISVEGVSASSIVAAATTKNVL